jgi:hypothetical protein
MNPHQRTRRFPILHGVALRKPRRRATVMQFASHIVIYPRIWGRQPTAMVLLASVTYEVISAYMPRNGNIKRPQTFDLVYFNCQFLHQD